MPSGDDSDVDLHTNSGGQPVAAADQVLIIDNLAF